MHVKHLRHFSNKERISITQEIQLTQRKLNLILLEINQKITLRNEMSNKIRDQLMWIDLEDNETKNQCIQSKIKTENLLD